MKLFKKLATLCLSLTMCLGLGATIAACGGDDASTSSSSVQDEIAYKFQIVKADDSPAEGYKVLLCKGDENCGTPVAADANGIVNYPVSKLPGEKKADAYDIHVMSAESSDYLTLTTASLLLTPTTFSATRTIPLKLAA